MGDSYSNGQTFGLGAVGAVVGGIIGYLLRPSVFLVGQLPFEIVITRGANLTGLNTLLKSAAETSFNYLAAGIVAGLVCGIVVGRLVSKKKRSSTN